MIYSIITGILIFLLSRYLEISINNIFIKAFIEEFLKSIGLIYLFILIIIERLTKINHNKGHNNINYNKNNYNNTNNNNNNNIKILNSTKKNSYQFNLNFNIKLTFKNWLAILLSLKSLKNFNLFILNCFLIYFTFTITENIFYFIAYPTNTVYLRIITGFLIHINTGLLLTYLISKTKIINFINNFKLNINLINFIKYIAFYLIFLITTSLYHYSNNIILYKGIYNIKILFIANPILFLILLSGTINNMKNYFLFNFLK